MRKAAETGDRFRASATPRITRSRITRWITALALLLTAPLAGVGSAPLAQEAASEAARVSEPGVYRGYTDARYGDWVRTSRYIEVRDGTRLAADILRPAVEGEPVEEPRKLIMGPWFHQQWEGLDLGTERLRWFDRWLKGVDNGIDREPPARERRFGPQRPP